MTSVSFSKPESLPFDVQRHAQCRVPRSLGGGFSCQRRSIPARSNPALVLSRLIKATFALIFFCDAIWLGSSPYTHESLDVNDRLLRSARLYFFLVAANYFRLYENTPLVGGSWRMQPAWLGGLLFFFLTPLRTLAQSLMAFAVPLLFF